MIRSVRSKTAGQSGLETRCEGLNCPLTKCSANRSVTPSVAQRILSFGSVRPARLSNRTDDGPCAIAAQNHQARKDLIRQAWSSDHLQGSHPRHSLSPTRSSITVPHPLEASIALFSRLLRCPGAHHPVEATILGLGGPGAGMWTRTNPPAPLPPPPSGIHLHQAAGFRPRAPEPNRHSGSPAKPGGGGGAATLSSRPQSVHLLLATRPADLILIAMIGYLLH